MRSIDETFETFGKRVLWLGYAGEEDRSTLIVDLHDILLEFPGATAVLKVRPPNEKAAYPAITETIDDKLHWSIDDSDTAKEGRGELQLSLISPTGSKIKTAVAAMEISRSLPDGGQKPDRIDDWMENAEAARKKAEEAATKANTAASNADTAASKAEAKADLANDAATKAGTATTKANEATSKANTAASNADTATNNANAATSKANTAASNADTATSNANAATTKANEAALNANTATNNANTATIKANEATSKANTAASNADTATSNANAVTAKANEATSKANTAASNADAKAKLANDAAKRAEDAAEKADKACQNILIGSETGNPVSVSDAFSAPLCGLTVYGKSTQDGTPSPDNPVPIVSAGDGGNMAVKVTGKNLLYIPDGVRTVRGVTITSKNGRISISGTATENGYVYLSVKQISVHGLALLSSNVSDPVAKLVSESWEVLFVQGKANATQGVITRICFIVKEGTTYDSDGINVQLEFGSTATAYSPYREQLLTLPTPNGLPGIPVTSGGNYTDENGQQWVCDEVDFGKSVKVRRIDKGAFDATKTLAEQNAILAAPVETPLTEAELAAYKALITYASNTVVQASDGAGLKLDYQRDVNIVIKNLEDAIASMTTA